jgi:hypothetical protein
MIDLVRTLNHATGGYSTNLVIPSDVKSGPVRATRNEVEGSAFSFDFKNGKIGTRTNG